jgi:hypothetical protein
MSAWTEGPSELEWYRRMRDCYTEIVAAWETNEHLERLWLEERRRSKALLKEVEEIRRAALSIGEDPVMIPYVHLIGLFDILEEHEREMEMPF